MLSLNKYVFGVLGMASLFEFHLIVIELRNLSIFTGAVRFKQTEQYYMDKLHLEITKAKVA